LKIIITGGAGFIGSHLAELCLNNGHEVFIIDNFSQSHPDNLSHIPNAHIIEGDIRNPDKYESVFKDAHYVFHLAGLADIVPSVENPYLYHDVNVNGTIKILEVSRKYSIKKFIYAASSSCYGIPEKYPTDEKSSIEPQYPYALSKRCAEEYVLHWGKLYNLDVMSLRLFNVYGTRSRTNGTYGAVFGVFLAQKLAQSPFTVVGDGEQSRDFIYVTDVARAFLKAAESKISQGIYNVGTGNPQSINKLVKLLKGPVEYIPKRPGEPETTCANINAIRTDLNWEPSISFEEGVFKILSEIDYWKEAKVWSSSEINEATSSWFKYLGEK
jgi:UDP-glucose 4-epimerase